MVGVLGVIPGIPSSSASERDGESSESARANHQEPHCPITITYKYLLVPNAKQQLERGKAATTGSYYPRSDKLISTYRWRHRLNILN